MGLPSIVDHISSLKWRASLEIISITGEGGVRPVASLNIFIIYAVIGSSRPAS